MERTKCLMSRNAVDKRLQPRRNRRVWLYTLPSTVKSCPAWSLALLAKTIRLVFDAIPPYLVTQNTRTLTYRHTKHTHTHVPAHKTRTLTYLHTKHAHSRTFLTKVSHHASESFSQPLCSMTCSPFSGSSIMSTPQLASPPPLPIVSTPAFASPPPLPVLFQLLAQLLIAALSSALEFGTKAGARVCVYVVNGAFELRFGLWHERWVRVRVRVLDRAVGLSSKHVE